MTLALQAPGLFAVVVASWVAPSMIGMVKPASAAWSYRLVRLPSHWPPRAAFAMASVGGGCAERLCTPSTARSAGKGPCRRSW